MRGVAAAAMAAPRKETGLVMAKGTGDTAETAPRRGRPRSVETTNAILEGAYALMATTGLAATTIDAVARHSDVSKMTIYKWWPSREANASLGSAQAQLTVRSRPSLRIAARAC